MTSCRGFLTPLLAGLRLVCAWHRFGEYPMIFAVGIAGANIQHAYVREDRKAQTFWVGFSEGSIAREKSYWCLKKSDAAFITTSHAR